MNKYLQEGIDLIKDAMTVDEYNKGKESAENVVRVISKKEKEYDGKIFKTNDINYLINNGSTEEQAIQTLIDSKAYRKKDLGDQLNQVGERIKSNLGVTSEKVMNDVVERTINSGFGSVIKDKSKIAGPNGKIYEKNDLDYLKQNGYTKEQAVQILSQCEKYTKLPDLTQPDGKPKKKTLQETWQEISSYDWHMITKTAAQEYVNGKLEDMLAQNIDKVLGKFGAKVNWTEENKQELRNVIAGHYIAKWNAQQVIDNAIKLTEDKLNELVESKVENVLNQKVTDAINITDNVNNKINDALGKISGQSGKLPNAEEISAYVATKLDTFLNGDKALGGFTNNISNSLGNIDKEMAKIGLDFGFQGMFKDVLGGVTQEITSNLSKNIGNEIAKSAQEIVKVQKEITKVQDFIKREQKIVQEQIDTWKKKASDEIKKQETKIIQSALGSLKGSLKFKF